MFDMGILNSDDDRRRKHEADDVDAQLVAALERVAELSRERDAWRDDYYTEHFVAGDLRADLAEAVRLLERQNRRRETVCYSMTTAVVAETRTFLAKHGVAP